jgi:hypothetical protein
LTKQGQNAQGTLSLTRRASAVRSCVEESEIPVCLFREDGKKIEIPVTSLNHPHSRVREQIIDGKKHQALPADFVLHRLRHTSLLGSEKQGPMRLQS